MTSLSLEGKLSPEAAEALAATKHFDDGIDLKKHGTHLIGKSGKVSYFATVEDHKVTEYFCTDESGARVPSFTAQASVGEGKVCFVCSVQDSGGYGGGHVCCHRITCPYPM